MEDFRIDSQKIMYHVENLGRWLKGKKIYPIYIEAAPAGGCNHRCIFCALDYLKYKLRFIDSRKFKQFISQVAKKGTKSIMFAGEGEPLLHKDIVKFITYAKQNGLDVAMTTNGVLLNKKNTAPILKELSWLRLSINAGTAKTYSLVHRCQIDDFKKVINNLKEAVKIKKAKGYKCTIGVQLLLLNENYREVSILAKILSKVGVDYLTVKPYSQHPSSLNRLKTRLNYQKLLYLEKQLKKYSKKGFQVIFRKHTMKKLRERKPYQRCLGLPFWSYLDSGGNLYACSAFLGDKRFCYGNIYQSSFEKVWNGKQRKKIMLMMKNSWDIEKCREVCRLDEINRYLWNLKHPSPHINFI